MLYSVLKESEDYINAEDIEISVNGEEPIDEEYYYVDEVCLLDNLTVVGIGHKTDGTLHVDLICSNWDKRFESDWVPES